MKAHKVIKKQEEYSATSRSSAIDWLATTLFYWIVYMTLLVCCAATVSIAVVLLLAHHHLLFKIYSISQKKVNEAAVKFGFFLLLSNGILPVLASVCVQVMLKILSTLLVLNRLHTGTRKSACMVQLYGVVAKAQVI